IFLTIMFIEVVLSASFDPADLVALFVAQIGLGGIGGVVFSCLSRWMVGAVRLPGPSLYPLLVLALAAACYSGTAAIGRSGFLAVYLQGVVLRSGELPNRQEVVAFHEGLAWLALISLFVLMGLYMFPLEV